MTPAVFLDRDGTLIESVHYLNRVDQVKLIPGAGKALCALEEMGYLRIVVTNQAAIGKGLLTEEGLHEIHVEVARQLALQQASIDGWYFCPVVGQGGGREVIEHPDRKPGPGMLLKAARDHAIDLHTSWMVGDTVSDTLAGRNAGCSHTVFVESGLSPPGEKAHPSVDHVLTEANSGTDLIRNESKQTD
ncbi:MAG: HAD family hydrolase [Proteobacteria bacterium]|nr:HAD family hydrolase [Pseudomonadota bacterium]